MNEWIINWSINEGTALQIFKFPNRLEIKPAQLITIFSTSRVLLFCICCMRKINILYKQNDTKVWSLLMRLILCIVFLYYFLPLSFNPLYLILSIIMSLINKRILYIVYPHIYSIYTAFSILIYYHLRRSSETWLDESAV